MFAVESTGAQAAAPRPISREALRQIARGNRGAAAPARWWPAPSRAPERVSAMPVRAPDPARSPAGDASCRPRRSLDSSEAPSCQAGTAPTMTHPAPACVRRTDERLRLRRAGTRAHSVRSARPAAQASAARRRRPRSSRRPTRSRCIEVAAAAIVAQLEFLQLPGLVAFLADVAMAETRCGRPGLERR